MPDSSRKDPEMRWGKFAGMGLETAVGVGLGYIVGNWLDTKYGWSPWGVLVGLMLGLCAGTYLLLKELRR